MVYSNSNLRLDKMLLQFIAKEDPTFSMFKWLCEQLRKLKLPARTLVIIGVSFAPSTLLKTWQMTCSRCL